MENNNNWNDIKAKYIKDCTRSNCTELYIHTMKPMELFEWFKREITACEGKTLNDVSALPIPVVSGSLPSSEDVKRWYQLLIGKGEEAMYKDMRQ